MTDLSPLLLESVLVPKPWGGRRLEALGKSLPEDGPYGESWEVADLPAGHVSSAARSRTLVSHGAHAGMSLRSLIEEFGSHLIGSAPPTTGGDFPLLVKMLDARENLSIQVHPAETYVSTHPDCHHKTESWYVADADPGSLLFLGLREGVTLDHVQAATGTSALADLMNQVGAVPGGFHHLPAGLVHAVGAGVLIVEVQTPSDTTFRMYDWHEKYSRVRRPLHIAEALEALSLDPAGVVSKAPMSGPGTRLLIATDHYWMREHRMAVGPIGLHPGRGVRILTVMRGEIEVADSRESGFELSTGSTALIPAEIAEGLSIRAKSTVLLLETGLIW